jgi:hypothetical protein
MKHEMKIEFRENEILEEVIKSSYFSDNNKGKLIGKKCSITINVEEPLYIALRGLNNNTINILNEDLIDGSMRCIVEESPNSIGLFPINNYCIIQDQKYSFY